MTAINLEALQMMRRGAPPSGANPFPVALPLNAATAAAGLVAAGAQQAEDGAAGQQGSPAASGAAAGNLGSAPQGWVSTEQQQQGAGQHAGSAVDSGAAGAAEGYGWNQLPSHAQAGNSSAQAQSAYGAAAVVQLQPQGQQRMHQSALSCLPDFPARSPQQSGLPAAVPKVYVERGPGRSPAGAAAAGSPQKAAAAGSPQTKGRSVGVKKVQQGAGGRPTQGR